MRVVVSVAEGEGFEPSIPQVRDNGFQDRRHRPLGHPSVDSVQQDVVNSESLRFFLQSFEQLLILREFAMGAGTLGKIDAKCIEVALLREEVFNEGERGFAEAAEVQMVRHLEECAHERVFAAAHFGMDLV